MAKKKNGTALAVDAATVEELAHSLRKQWEKPGQMVGTACQCGAHTNTRWEDGGREWLTAHVAEVHPTAFDWPAAIRKALAMPDALDALAFLQTLVPEEDEKGSLGDA